MQAKYNFLMQLPVIDKPWYIAKFCCIDDKRFWLAEMANINMSFDIIYITASFFITSCLYHKKFPDKYIVS